MPTPPSPETTGRRTAAQALDALVAAYDDYEEAVTAEEEDPRGAFDIASEAVEKLGEMRTRASTTRARCAVRFAAVNKYSLGRLADETGVTKRRAQEWGDRVKEWAERVKSEEGTP